MIELDQALEALRTVVARKGQDYVYDGARTPGGDCVYQSDGQPQCIVGHVLAELFPDGEWLEFYVVSVNQSADTLASDDEAATYTAAAVLRTAQLWQDDGETWGIALQRAEECARAQA